jgi:hypothetical protein
VHFPRPGDIIFINVVPLYNSDQEAFSSIQVDNLFQIPNTFLALGQQIKEAGADLYLTGMINKKASNKEVFAVGGADKIFKTHIGMPRL